MGYKQELIKKGYEYENNSKKWLCKTFILKEKTNSYFPDIEIKYLNESIGIECKFMKDFRLLTSIINSEMKKITNFNKIYLLLYGNDKNLINFKVIHRPLDKKEFTINLLKKLKNIKPTIQI